MKALGSTKQGYPVVSRVLAKSPPANKIDDLAFLAGLDGDLRATVHQVIRLTPTIVEIVLHAHMAGRPTLIPTIRKCIAYAKQHNDVFFARKRDIAEWALKLDKESSGS